MSPGPSVCVSGVGVVDGVTRVDVDAVEGVRRVPACPARRLTPGSRGNYSLLLVGVGTLNDLRNTVDGLRLEYIVLVGRQGLHAVLHDLLSHELLAVHKSSRRRGAFHGHPGSHPHPAERRTAERLYGTAPAEPPVKLVEQRPAEPHPKSRHAEPKSP